MLNIIFSTEPLFKINLIYVKSCLFVLVQNSGRLWTPGGLLQRRGVMVIYLVCTHQCLVNVAYIPCSAIHIMHSMLSIPFHFIFQQSKLVNPSHNLKQSKIHEVPDKQAPNPHLLGQTSLKVIMFQCSVRANVCSDLKLKNLNIMTWEMSRHKVPVNEHRLHDRGPLPFGRKNSRRRTRNPVPGCKYLQSSLQVSSFIS